MNDVRRRRVQAVVDRIVGGERLITRTAHRKLGYAKEFFFHPSWQPASPAAVDDAIAVGEIKFVERSLIGSTSYLVWGA